MGTKSVLRELEFGDGESHVRIFEETDPENLASEISRRLSRRATEDDLYLAGGRAAVRSTRYEGLGSGRVPHGLFLLRSHRELGSRLPADLRPYPLVAASRRIHTEIRDPAFGPGRLLAFAPHADGSREEIRDAYLDAVRFGDTDVADHIFAWLFANISPEDVADLLWTGGLHGVGLGSFKLTGALEVFLLLQALGWHNGEVLLRGVVRHQAHRLAGDNPFDLIRDLIEAEDLLSRARRRLPGERGRGEDDPGGVWDLALKWASSPPHARTELAVRALGGDWALEDYWEAVSLGTAVMFLGASVSGMPVSRAAQMAVATYGLRGMIRYGGLSQKVLASLLAGRTPEFASLDPGWIDVGVRLLEAGLRASRVSADQLGGALENWNAELALGCIASTSADAAGFSNAISIIDHRLAFLHGLEGLGPAFHLAQCEAYQAGRSQHRWVHVACSAWLCAIWPDRGLLDEPALAELADRRRRSLARGRKGR
ncbi:MAG: hypothetical protein FJY88_11560 [Candidatus Eisenbacteria bacterium]|nr:hypothetical protein [Candidatus Eisenbacteria bacterium]